MTNPMLSRRWRWAAPGVVAAGVAGAALVSNNAIASGRPVLPARTAAQLLAAVESSHVTALSGTVVETARLGLPALPSGIGGGSADASLSLQSLVTGSHTFRVWTNGPDRQRLALLGQLSESDVVHDGRDMWTYSSSTRSVTHVLLPAQDAKKPAVDHSGTLTPQQAAAQALAAINPSTKVTVDRTARVAGRPAYQLVLSPRDGRSTIGRVQLALDSATALPLRVQVFAKGARKPAIEVGFTEISLRAPAASLFRFVPPAGTKVHESTLGAGSRPKQLRSDQMRMQMMPRQKVAPRAMQSEMTHAAGDRSVIGKGWTAVWVADASMVSSAPATSASPMTRSDSTSALINKIAVPVNGGRLIKGSLFSVLLSDNGKIYVGAVSPADLQRVAATGRAL